MRAFLSAAMHLDKGSIRHWLEINAPLKASQGSIIACEIPFSFGQAKTHWQDRVSFGLSYDATK